LILSPTRELALQISIVIKEISKKILSLSLSHYQQHQQLHHQQKESQHNSHHHHHQQQKHQVKVSIEVVTIVGGMSEHKQKRQLSGMGE
jgi:superfamily II DNA/RNA helicase